MSESLDSVRLGAPDLPWLEQSYDAFPRIEEEFQAVLDSSLHPRGPDLLYDLVAALDLSAGAAAVDVGCGEGAHTLQLAERFGFTVTGVDPVARHLELANEQLTSVAARAPEIGSRVRFVPGAAEALPIADGSADLIWCRDVLVHVADLPRTYVEFCRILRDGGHVLVYQMFAGDRLEPREADSFWKTMGVVPTSADPANTGAAIAAAGLRIADRIELDWGEWAEERTGKSSRKLLHAARLLRDPQRYVVQFGQSAYDIMLGDCLWHVYGMIGKLDRRVYLLSRT